MHDVDCKHQGPADTNGRVHPAALFQIQPVSVQREGVPVRRSEHCLGGVCNFLRKIGLYEECSMEDKLLLSLCHVNLGEAASHKITNTCPRILPAFLCRFWSCGVIEISRNICHMEH